LVVDGGHRAIKYTRISGVKKEIYSEGVFFFLEIWAVDEEEWTRMVRARVDF